MTKEEMKIVNTTLETLYGCGVEERTKLGFKLATSDERPRYRVVVAGEQFEPRKGRFEKFSDTHGAVLSSSDVVRNCPKYGLIAEDPQQIVLEKLIFVPKIDELPNSGRIDYELLYLFRPDQQDPSLIMKMVQLIIYAILNEPTKVASDYADLEMKQKAKRLEVARQIIDDRCDTIGVKEGRSIVVPGEVKDAGDSSKLVS